MHSSSQDSFRLQLAADESGESGDVSKLLASHECARKLFRSLLAKEQHPVRLVRDREHCHCRC